MSLRNKTGLCFFVFNLSAVICVNLRLNTTCSGRIQGDAHDFMRFYVFLTGLTGFYGDNGVSFLKMHPEIKINKFYPFNKKCF